MQGKYDSVVSIATEDGGVAILWTVRKRMMYSVVGFHQSDTQARLQHHIMSVMNWNIIKDLARAVKEDDLREI